MCARNINGGKLNPNLRQVELSLNETKQIFNPEFLQQLDFIQLCGNFGDPIAAKDTLEICEYFRSENPKIRLGLHTNGGLKPVSWWSRLGALLSHHGDYCKFGIDGLADTNAIYRRGTSWDKIINNVNAFIFAGSIAHWEFLVFRHNEHQIEEARQLAEKMGFAEFYIKKTSRFFNYQNGKNEPFPIHDQSGQTVDHLYPPENEALQNPVSRFRDLAAKPQQQIDQKLTQQHKAKVTSSIEKAKTLLATFSTLSEYLSKTDIDCMTMRDHSIYISARGEVYPCCFLAGQVRYAEPGVDGARLNQLVAACGGSHRISALEQPVQSAIDDGWFSAIEKSWRLPTTSDQAINTCRRMCGKNLQLVTAEYG